MSDRWSILALLFAVRTTMAFQFQSVAALAPLVQREFGVGLADLGLAIGLYLAPGIALALPGGAIGRRYGDKSVVIAGLALMICGGLVMAASGGWTYQLLGRLLAGIGGVLLNVLMSKMVADWFAGKEIATAMAIFVTPGHSALHSRWLSCPLSERSSACRRRSCLQQLWLPVGWSALPCFTGPPRLGVRRSRPMPGQAARCWSP